MKKYRSNAVHRYLLVSHFDIGGAELLVRSMARTWAPVGRGPRGTEAAPSQDGTLGSAEGSDELPAVPSIEPSSAATGATTSGARFSGDDNGMPPDPWADWYRAQAERVDDTNWEKAGNPTDDRHSGSSSWNDRDWQRGRDGGSWKTSWNDSDWDKSRRTGWLSDGQIRNFNVANMDKTTAMCDGRWSGSGWPDRTWTAQDGEWNDAGWNDFSLPKTTEKVPIPTFSGEGGEQEVGHSARSYVRKVQVWLRCTRLPAAQRALALYNALTDRVDRKSVV